VCEVRKAHRPGGRRRCGRCCSGAPWNSWPAQSTIGELFEPRGTDGEATAAAAQSALECPVCAFAVRQRRVVHGFKGLVSHMRMGSHCEPLTLSDAYSRYFLRCQVMESQRHESMSGRSWMCFREFGLPHRLRSDNGAAVCVARAGGRRSCRLK